MNRRRFCERFSLTLAAAAACPAVRALASQQGPRPGAVDAESYAIWSMLIPVLRPGAKEYLIPDVTTVPYGPIRLPPTESLTRIQSVARGLGVDVQVPVADRESFLDAAARANAKVQEPLALWQEFTLDRPYKLLSADELAEYRRIAEPVCVVDPLHPWHRNLTLEQKYAKFSAPCFFSRVYFDKTMRLGLVWVEESKREIASFTAYCFQKEADSWKRRDWPAAAEIIMC